MENNKEVRFDKYCQSCKHLNPEVNPYAGNYDGDSWSGNLTAEEKVPCCYCITEAMREGTEVPLEWEEK